ncbi:MAG: hypothetical protein PHH83_01845 [Patescibacteria group bacterium]|nr:hypothetical protein [Patescibacteria group bacterium]
MDKKQCFLRTLEDIRIIIQKKIKKPVYFKEKLRTDKYSGFSSLSYLFYIEERVLLLNLFPIKKKKILCELDTFTHKISILDNRLVGIKKELDKIKLIPQTPHI